MNPHFATVSRLRGRCPSGQREQAVNLPAQAYGGSNPSRPTSFRFGDYCPNSWTTQKVRVRNYSARPCRGRRQGGIGRAFAPRVWRVCRPPWGHDVTGPELCPYERLTTCASPVWRSSLSLSGSLCLPQRAVTTAGSSAATTGGGAATTGAGGAATTGAGGAKAAKVGVILPDTKSSVRWETADRPFLEEAFKAAGVEYDIQNAEGDKTKMATIADQMITERRQRADDRQPRQRVGRGDREEGRRRRRRRRSTTTASPSVARPPYYVSFDNVKVGELQGRGPGQVPDDKGAAKPAVAVLNGSPTDNNATLFEQGYNAVLDAEVRRGRLTRSTTRAFRTGTTRRAARSSSRC